MGTCYIVGAGSFYGWYARPEAEDLVIAADGGYAACLREHVTPELVIGDFDSLEREPQRGDVIRLPVEKDDTDTLAAIRLGLDRGYRQFHFYGCTGGERPEHTLANLQCLLFLAEHDAVGWLYDRASVCTVLRNGTLTFPAGCRGNLSVFAAGGPAHGVTLRGLKYSLTDADLTPALPLGVSNSFTGAAAEVTVCDGTLLVWYDLQGK